MYREICIYIYIYKYVYIDTESTSARGYIVSLYIHTYLCCTVFTYIYTCISMYIQTQREYLSARVYRGWFQRPNPTNCSMCVIEKRDMTHACHIFPLTQTQVLSYSVSFHMIHVLIFHMAFVTFMSPTSMSPTSMSPTWKSSVMYSISDMFLFHIAQYISYI